jgi:hypothetical protein
MCLELAVGRAARHRQHPPAHVRDRQHGAV